jgi:hypothetical protein
MMKVKMKGMNKKNFCASSPSMARLQFVGALSADNSGLTKLPSLRYGSFVKPRNVKRNALSTYWW